MLKSSVRKCHGHHITWLTVTEYLCHKCHGHHITWLTVTEYMCHTCHGHHITWLTVTEYLCHKCHGHYIIWLTVTEYLCHKWPRTSSVCCIHNLVLSSFITYHRVCNKSKTVGVTSGAGTANPSGALAFIPDL